MKIKLLLAVASLLGAGAVSFSQENEIPQSGNVGLGTTEPTEKLDVRGGARIDLALKVGDSLTVQNSAHVGNDLTVTGNTYLKADVYIAGTLQMNAPASGTEEILFLGEDGILKSGGDLQGAMYTQHSDVQDHCKDGNNGNTTPASPIWLHSPGKLYASRDCIPDIKVGIGNSNPVAKLHISLNNNAPGINTPAILVQQGNGNKILQLTEDGLLQAREIKVDVASWPDYVFEENYMLMPLDEVAAYIEQFDHLPGVPSACEMEQQGMNLTQTSVMLLEKIEELTLYMLQLQNQLKLQQQQLDMIGQN